MGLVTLSRVTLVIVFLLMLSACGPGTKLGSIAGGECALPGVHTPQYKVLGKRLYDQNWVDDTTEGLVRGCNQPRPLARPASFDKPKVRPKPKVKPKAVPLPPKSPVSVAPPVVVENQKPVAPISPPVLQTTPAPELVPVPKRRWWQR